jgi:hypothetical protein
MGDCEKPGKEDREKLVSGTRKTVKFNERYSKD